MSYRFSTLDTLTWRLRRVRAVASLFSFTLVFCGLSACGDDGGEPEPPDASAPDNDGPVGADGGAPADLNDSFDGSGPLIGYTINNELALPDIARVDGRYRANLVDNTNDITLHFNDAQGRLDAKLVAFPFDIVVRNIGIGTDADSQTAPPPTNDPYNFAGVQVHVTDLESRNSSHVVVGHRGPTHFTVEGKNTRDGTSSVDDVGADTVPAGRADIRVVGNADRTLTIYWQEPNPDPGGNPDQWTPYNGTGTLPGAAPDYGDTVYVGLITYAYGQEGVPFVGTCDAIEQL